MKEMVVYNRNVKARTRYNPPMQCIIKFEDIDSNILPKLKRHRNVTADYCPSNPTWL